jgi:hypothetical protein
MDSAKMKRISEESNSGTVPKQKLIDEVKKYKKVLEDEERNLQSDPNKDRLMINDLNSHLGEVEGLIKNLVNSKLEVVVNRLTANETDIITGIGNLKKQVIAKPKNPASLKSIINQFNQITEKFKGKN